MSLVAAALHQGVDMTHVVEWRNQTKCAVVASSSVVSDVCCLVLCALVVALQLCSARKGSLQVAKIRLHRVK